MTTKDEVREDKYIYQDDHSTTRIARATECCGGYHQTIAGAILKSKYWKDWYDHASKNMLFDVDETLTVDAMSDEHFESFMKFCLDSLLAKKREEIEKLKAAKDETMSFKLGFNEAKRKLLSILT